MTDAELNALAEHFFANAVAGDHDAVEAMLAPGATLTQNGVTLTFAEVRRGMEAILAAIGQWRYEEVRRVTGANAVVEEHQVRSTTPKGVKIDIPACVVIRVDDQGRITSLDEYADPTALTSL